MERGRRVRGGGMMGRWVIEKREKEVGGGLEEGVGVDGDGVGSGGVVGGLGVGRVGFEGEGYGWVGRGEMRGGEGVVVEKEVVERVIGGWVGIGRVCLVKGRLWLG